jgi:hypothetical protein
MAPNEDVAARPLRKWLSVGQGAFYLATGIWPLLHLRSFEAVTGPKLEGWLVKTAGTLITAIGYTLLRAGLRGRVDSSLRDLAVGSAAGLAAIDVWYAGARRRISPIYLADAAVEACLIGAWAVEGLKGRRAAIP